MSPNLNLRLSVTHLRALLLVANVVLAVGLVGIRAMSILTAGTDVSEVEVADPSEFYYEPIALPQTTGASRLRVAAERLQPKEPPPPALPGDPTEEAPVEDEVPEEDVAEGGPLEEEWEYAFYILNRTDPGLTQVTLRKKGADTKRPAVRRPTVRGRRPSRIRTSSRRSAAKPTESAVTFYVRDRNVRDEELDLDFYVDSADEERLVYWTDEGGPKNMYYLSFPKRTPYERSDRRRISPEDEAEEEEKNEEGETEEEPKPFKLRPVDFEHNVEDEYRLLKTGQIKPEDAKNLRERKEGVLGPAVSEGLAPLAEEDAGAEASATGEAVEEEEEAAEEETAEASEATPGGGGSTRSSRRQLPAKPQRKMSDAEGIRKMGEILEQADKDNKLSEKDRESVKKLREMLKRPKRK